MNRLRLSKILDDTYQRRFLCSWIGHDGNVHTGLLANKPCAEDDQDAHLDDICAACGASRREHLPGGIRHDRMSLCGVFIPSETATPTPDHPESSRG